MPFTGTILVVVKVLVLDYLFQHRWANTHPLEKFLDLVQEFFFPC